jgi:hypothetical protein
VVSGCNEFGHINVRYYCEKHWETIKFNAGDREMELTCWGCKRIGLRFGKADDYIVEHV